MHRVHRIRGVGVAILSCILLILNLRNAHAVEYVGVGGMAPSIVLDSAGGIHVAHIDYYSDGSTMKVQYSVKSGSSWSTTTLASGGRYDFTWIGRDSAGNLYVGFSDDTPLGAGKVCKMSKPPSGSWSGITVIDSGASPNSVGDDMAMAVSSEGQTYFFYRKESNAGQDEGLAFNGSYLFTQNYGGSCAALCDSANNIHLVYCRSSNLYYRKRVGTSWDPEQLIHSGVSVSWSGGRPGIAIDSAGKVHVTYAVPALGYRPHYANNVSGSWTVVGAIENVSCRYGACRCAIDPGDSLHVAYYDEGSNKCKYAKRNASSWDVTTVDSLYDPGGPDIAAQSNGTVHLVYSRYSGEQLWYHKIENSSPTDISLSNSTVAENQLAGTAVGTLSTTDPDAGNTFTYTLVSGAGSADNSSFTIAGNSLQTAAIFDYESKNSYNIRARTTDQGGLWYEKPFVVSVSDVAEPPATPTNLSPADGALSQSITPTLQASAFTDPDIGDTHAASQWVLRRASDSLVAFDSGDDAINKTNRTLPAGCLAYSETYAWQVRYKDNRATWSPYSAQTTFTTLAPPLGATRQGTNIVFVWPTDTPGFGLYASTNLASPSVWSAVTSAPVVVSGQYVISNSFSGPRMFYRLKKP